MNLIHFDMTREQLILLQEVVDIATSWHKHRNDLKLLKKFIDQKLASL